MDRGMPRAFENWKVLPHGPIEELADNLWWVAGSLPGMSLRRAMTIARMDDGRLVVHSAVALEDGAMQKIEAWGEPAFLLVPNGGHRLDALAYTKRYPNIRVLSPKGSRARVEQALPVNGTYEDFPNTDTVRLDRLRGVGGAEGVMFVRSSDGVTIVLNDAVFNMDRKRDPLGFFFTTVLGSAPGPRVSRLAKLLFVKDGPAFREHLEKLADTPELTRLVVAHEKVAHGADAAAALRTAATFVRSSPGFMELARRRFEAIKAR